MRHRPASRLLPVPAARPRPLVQESLQAADERPERDAGARTLDHRTKVATRLPSEATLQPVGSAVCPSQSLVRPARGEVAGYLGRGPRRATSAQPRAAKPS